MKLTPVAIAVRILCRQLEMEAIALQRAQRAKTDATMALQWSADQAVALTKDNPQAA